MPPGIHDNRRALGAQLFKGHRLARLIGKSPPCLRVGQPMVETVAQHDCQDLKAALTRARCTALVQRPAATFPLLRVLLDLGTFCVVTHHP